VAREAVRGVSSAPASERADLEADDAVPVAFVAPKAGHGGSERYLEVLVASLGPRWVEAIVALEDGPLVGRLRGLGHEVTVLSARGRRGVLRGAVGLRRVLARHHAAVIHANGVKAALVAALAAPQSGPPILWSKHDFSWDGPLARAIGARSRQIVAVSGVLTTTFRGATARKVHIVPAGIPAPAVDRVAARSALAEAIGCPVEAPIVTLVGRLQASKGQLELLEAAPEILARLPDVRFCFVGEDHPFQPEYGRLVRERTEVLGLDSAVTFAGHRGDAVELIAGSDVTVLPSMPDDRGRGREGSPLVAIEALAVGTPVVGYDHGGIPDAVGDAGRLVPAGDRAGLRDAIVGLLENEALRAEMAARGRERVAERNAPAAMAAAMMDRYREAAGRVGAS
jgi:glycosyltransferase involved in cell wall biosynthesis